jgi:Uma2 family endonuclease
MSDRISLDEYLSGPEDMRRRELVWGVVREPPAARFGHQTVVTQITVLLRTHVHGRGLGVVCVSPADVVLDKEKALIVQPDVFFIAKDRMDIVRDQVWGAPDLVVEGASPSTARYDRTTKLGWYRTYGVRECWLIDTKQRVVMVVAFEGEGHARSFTGDERVVSAVLPEFKNDAREFFD